MAPPPKKKVLPRYPTRTLMIEELEDVRNDDFEAELEALGIEEMYELNVTQTRNFYKKYVRDCAGNDNEQNEDTNMESFTATVIENRHNRTVDILIENVHGEFLTSGLVRIERQLGGEAPVFLTLPMEIYVAIKRS
jgi:hypothetical protein